uniref:C-type lectin domain-containing protein n=1 Tax=Sparus aurata TaxID=8175 RepID=A0A671UBJ7_SPAAU
SRESGCSGSPGCCCHRFCCSQIQTLSVLPDCKYEQCFVALDSSLCCNLFKQNGPQCYYYSTDKLIWEQAREKCRRDGADLVKIESEDEQVEHTADEDKFWIGLTDSVTEGTWLWTDGTPLNKSLTFWGKGQPDNLKEGNANGQDCVRMGEISRSSLKWWFDKSCTAEYCILMPE